MSAVHITQLLCPLRHCIIAAAWEEDGATTEEAADMLVAQINDKGLFNPWCEICKSRELHTEDRVMEGYTSLQQAAPVIAAMQEANLRTRENFLRSQGTGKN